TKAGYREVTGLRPPAAAGFTLDPEDAIPRKMVRIPPGRPDPPALAFATDFQSVELPGFLIDRYEVTNSQYDQFVRDRGYDRPDYWLDLPWIDGVGQPAA